MKSKLSLCILAAAVSFQMLPERSFAADTLALANPGFEDQLSDWEAQEDGGMSKVTAEAAYAGKFGLRVTDDSEQAGSSLCSRKLPVSPGKTYQVQFRSRILTGNGIGVYLRFLKADGKVVVPVSEEEKTADRAPVVEIDKNQTDWKLLSGKRTAPAEAVAMIIYIHSYSKHKVTADFDDFAVSEIAN